NNQDMRRRLRVDVAEGEAVFVLIDDLRGNLSLDDLLEDVVSHHGKCPSGCLEPVPEKHTNQEAGGSLSSHVVTDHAPRTHQTCPGSSAWMKPATARTWGRSFRRPSPPAYRTASSASGPVWPKASAAR